ncbi:MAG: hypothetical protein RSA91_00320 [Bacilli bacterium]
MKNIQEISKKLNISSYLTEKLANICKEKDVNIKEVYFKKVKGKKNKYKIYIVDNKTKKKIYTFRYRIVKFNIGEKDSKEILELLKKSTRGSFYDKEKDYRN